MGNTLNIVLFVATFASDDYCTKQLDYLLALHDEYGLPHPPRDAILVRYVHTPSIRFEDGKRITWRYDPALGFSPDGRTVLNYEWKAVKVDSILAVKPDPAALGVTELGGLRDALYYHARGWRVLSCATYRRWIRDTNWRAGDPSAWLADIAWRYWDDRIDDPKTPMPVIIKHLKRVFSHPEQDGKGAHRMLKWMELATKPRNSPPGSDDALIDALLDVTGSPWRRSDEFLSDPRVRAIVRRGLEVVPALIAHLDDERMTRLSFRDGGHCLIKHVAEVLLEELAGRYFVDPEATRDEQLAVIGKWYADATKLGEQKHVVERILGDDEDDPVLRPTLLWLLAEKYPDHLPVVYRKLIDTRPRAFYIWEFSHAVANAPIPLNERRKMLEYAATRENPRHRAAGIFYLRALDPKLAKELLLANLAKLSPHLNDDEKRLAEIAAQGNDPDEWTALGFALRRATPCGRLELLRWIWDRRASEGGKRRLSLLAEYLTDDEEVERHWYDYRFPTIEVRNFVAWQLAEHFRVGTEEPGPDWTAKEWAELRATVKAKVKYELRRRQSGGFPW